MNGFAENSLFFGAAVSLAAYGLGLALRARFQKTVFNPLLIAIAATILALAACGVDYQTYYAGASRLSWLLTPATVCLAVPLYRQLALLRRHWRAVLAGIGAGVLTSLCCTLALALLFGLDSAAYATLLPKSITTAIGMGVSEQLGGHVTITVAVIVLTGIFGSVTAEGVFRLLHIDEPVARGLAIGTSAHAIGTARALELGEVEGAMSGLSIAVAGLLTVALAPLFARLAG